MKNIKITFCSCFILLICQLTYAQEENNRGRFSGSLETNANFFLEDTLIGAANTPQYDHQLFGADAWLQLNYTYKDLDIGLRFDLFNNSNLRNPQSSYNAQGIGRWYIKKKINKLGLAAGYLYDQIGSGIIFRAYEQRPLAIDNALYGLRATYDLTEDWQLKGFSGRQKFFFDAYQSVVRGFSIDGFVDGGEESSWTSAPGFGVVARTIDDETMRGVVSAINTYSVVDSISAKYNSYALTLYNTFNYKKISWYVEGAYKTEEQLFNPFAVKTNRDGTTALGKLVSESGNVLYSSVSYANKGLGVTLEGKRTEYFRFRNDPFAELNLGVVNFLPPMTRVNAYRLTARYQAATQELGEQSYQLDARYKLNKKWAFNLNYSYIATLNPDFSTGRSFLFGSGDVADDLLYQELYTEVSYKYKRKWSVLAGVQFQVYNQELYEVKPDAPHVETITPYVDVLYKFSRKKALRVELQYMKVGKDEAASIKAGENLGQDYGDWLFGLAEFTMAPHWTFTVSDMYNVNPGKNSPTGNNGKKKSVHYPRFDVYYSHKANRFSLSYVKQVEGIVCTGGICRLEPAFSGVKMGINSTF